MFIHAEQYITKSNRMGRRTCPSYGLCVVAEICLRMQIEREVKMYRSQNTISIDITPESLSEYLMCRYSNRRFDDFPYFLTALVGELRGGGFDTIGDVHKILERTKKAAEHFEDENPRSQLVGNRYSAIEIVIISISLLYNDFFISWPNILDKFSPEKLEKYKKLIPPETDETQPIEG
jgi:hypothetical protein